ncbi:MAG: hypothetical protein IPL46_10230 [Saprospiraceae bacterium]|nr:hypothetical protein [Saprospiraceae bacterium]
MLHDFYDRLTKNEFPDDASAATFYDYASEKDKAYRKQRNKLQQRLIDTSFFIDTSSPKFDTHQKAFYTCEKNMIAARILIGRNARRAALTIVEDTLRQCVKFEFSDLALDLSRMLRQHYGINGRNKSAFDKYTRLAELYSEIVNAEDLAVQHYERTSFLLNRDRKNAPEVIELCNASEIALKPLVAKCNWYRLHFLYYTILLRRESLKSDYEKVLEICDSALDSLENKKLYPCNFLAVFTTID